MQGHRRTTIVDFAWRDGTVRGSESRRWRRRGVAAMTTHRDYAWSANAAILAWCQAHDRKRRAIMEVYGHWHADPEQLTTDVYYLCTDAEAR
jgi:hypothetical protein